MVRGGHTPATRLIFALAAPTPPGSLRSSPLMLDDVDLGSRRLTIAGRVRPIGDLPLKLLLDWLERCHSRWPNTTNLHLLVNRRPPARTAVSATTGSALRCVARTRPGRPGPPVMLLPVCLGVDPRGWPGAWSGRLQEAGEGTGLADSKALLRFGVCVSKVIW